MLVLSRRVNEKIVLPNIQTTFEVVAIKGVTVRLGVQAPDVVAVLREEVWARDKDRKPVRDLLRGGLAWSGLQGLNHLLRNRLNASVIGLALLKRQLQCGLTQDSLATLERLEHEVKALGEQAAELIDQAQLPAPAPMKVRKALLVEDDQNERELLAGFLRLAGLEVDTAGDGTDALDYLHSHARPDVMLLDMMLPRCDGPTTLQAIRREPSLSGLKVFAISGYAPERFGLQKGEACVDRWFSKPFNPEILLRDLAQTFADAP
jgi:carbon storage regulator CsrA